MLDGDEGQVKIVVTDSVTDDLSFEKELLGPIGTLEIFNTSDLSTIAPELAECDAVLNVYAGPISAELIETMPRCKVISRYGIGVDTIDIAAATRAGIIVTNNPTYCIEEVAEHALALIMAQARKLAVYDRDVRDESWSLAPGKPMSRLKGKVLGLIGFGNIARALAWRAEGLGMEVIFSDPAVTEPVEGFAAKPASFDEVVAQSDFLSLHPPLNNATRHIVNAKTLAAMKPSATLVNVSRGPLVDTEALIDTLAESRIAGAVLDATDPEPLPETHPLRQLGNAIVTPHAAWYSEEAMALLKRGAPSEVAAVLSGRAPKHVVNPEVLAHCRADIATT
ncbi:hypothetical protein ACMU_04850 [Actibacterium mucosum KCTC 23349]|uniref:2-hydroxyacid dehydrogenase n=1 Tax=Actibacterium mucosum KCTC 23349 TaxID=1454373 RepID=A0A037ZEM0_9RHOB|nr:C-terminal binding protein [Actibacterium mucosum]KAJ53961.1 hypothetical protein ACMU_04850 [Actibacterium mucosum KCTC 23349]